MQIGDGRRDLSGDGTGGQIERGSGRDGSWHGNSGRIGSGISSGRIEFALDKQIKQRSDKSSCRNVGGSVAFVGTREGVYGAVAAQRLHRIVWIENRCL